ncbi:MAG: hypothetical protein IKB86_01695 [Clostridia bacterium]|nr:hypothetical protein [Clostridia bacterium]
MKKLLCLVLVLLIGMSIVGCDDGQKNDVPGTSDQNIGNQDSGGQNNGDKENDEEDNSDVYYNTFENFEDTFIKVVEQTKNYVIKQSDKHVGDFYEIYDNAGNLLDKGYHGYRGVFNISQQGNIVVLEYGFGGTNVFPTCKLYDVEKGVASSYYEGPVAVKNDLIAYFTEGKRIVVHNAFDYNKDRMQFTEGLEGITYVIRSTIKDIRFSEDGTQVIFEFLPLADLEDEEVDNWDDVVVTKVFELNK